MMQLSGLISLPNSINFAWGNLMLAQGKHEVALTRFQRALTLLEDSTPTELKVASTYFKLGCVYLELGNLFESMYVGRGHWSVMLVPTRKELSNI